MRLGVIHDAGPARGRLARMRRAFPDADAVVFGHSHHAAARAATAGFQIFNPGSPTERRRAPRHTMGIATATMAVRLEPSSSEPTSSTACVDVRDAVRR